MMIRVGRAAFWVPLLLMGVLLGSSFVLQDELIYRRRREPAQFRDSLYLPDSRYVRFISLGYNHWMADYLWLRMIQSFAAGWSRPENKAQMKAYFDVITDLDPHYIDAYRFSMMALSEGARPEQRDNRLILDTVDKAVLHNPRDSRIPIEGAYFAWWEANDAPLAKYYVLVAMKDPHYPSFIERWISFFELNLGRYRFAYEKIMGDLARAYATGDDVVQEILWRQLQRAVNMWFIHEIRTRAVAWHAEHGRYPTVEELDAAGAFAGVELPDWRAIRADFADAAARGINLAGNPSVLQQFINAHIRRWDRLPPGPHDDIDPRFRGYVIWAGMPENDRNFVLSRVQAVNLARGILEEIEAAAMRYQLDHNGQWPNELAEFSPLHASLSDPFGGQWTWDPQTHRAGCTSIPDLASIHLPDV